MGLSTAFNRFADRTAYGVFNQELSEFEPLFRSLSLREMTVADSSFCSEGESRRAGTIHNVARAIQTTAEVALRSRKQMAVVVPSLVSPSICGTGCKPNE
jgi:hypothetical protein